MQGLDGRGHRERFLLVAADAIMLPLALWSAFALRLGELAPSFATTWWLFLSAPALSIPVFIRTGLYRAIVRFMGAQVVITVVKVVTISALALAALTLFTRLQGVPRSVFIIYWGVALIYIGGSRYLMRAYFHARSIGLGVREPVAIYGAGATGRQLAMILNNGADYEPVAFLDDDRGLHGSFIHDIRVYSRGELSHLIDQLGVREVLLAIPSASAHQRQAILNYLEPYPVHVRTVPAMADLVSGAAHFDEIREVDISDLLGRDPMTPNRELLGASIRGKSVLVTGAGGSIGSELCRQIFRLAPRRLVLYEISEFSLYDIERELKGISIREGFNCELVPLLGSVQDAIHVESVMRKFKVQTVYHVAAYKHVPLVEYNMIEGVRNNVIGTLKTAEVASRVGVESFVLISTDKAVRPTNVMGASKRVAEMVLQGLSEQQQDKEREVSVTRFCIVRFGNVLGSSGSVVPLFREQILHGGPVTVTHPEITRYFMTIPEAAQLVLQAGSMARGGDIFVLDMGEPVRIAELARKMIHLMGLSVKDGDNPWGDIAIEYIGLRPGEKLYEELLSAGNATGTEHPRIMRAEEGALSWPVMRVKLERLEKALTSLDCLSVQAQLRELVEGYAPDGSIEDIMWRYSAQLEPAGALLKIVPLERRE